MIAILHAIASGPWPGAQGVDTDGFRDAVDVLLAMRRRIREDTTSPDDLHRYRQASATIERIARHRDVDRIAMDADQLSALLGPCESVFTPAEVARRSGQWRELLAPSEPANAFVTHLAACGSGLVITVQPVKPAAVELVPLPVEVLGPPVQVPNTQDRLADAIVSCESTIASVFPTQPNRGAAQTFRAQIAGAVRADHPINVALAANHEVLTEVLRDLQGTALPRGHLRLAFVDGSEAAPFPVGLPLQPGGSARRAVRFGLMSIRHMELDRFVDAYWFRNRSVSVSDRTFGETEKYCYQETLDRLAEMCALGVDRIEMVHTGFEPAVVGFYRAVADFVTQLPVTVVPYYFRPGSDDEPVFVEGTPWLVAR